MLIKVCGIKYAKDLAAVSVAGADLIGLNFYSPSPRSVNFPGPAHTQGFPGKLTGVFVDETADKILSTAEKYSLSAVQLHGNEPASLVDRIKGHLKVIKAIPVSDKSSLLKASEYANADYLLLDTATPLFGGSGKSFDWTLLDHYHEKTPFFIAGGIGPDDVTALEKLKHPAFAGVDINSRFEISPGIKNLDQLKVFISKIKKNMNYKTTYHPDQEGYYGEFGGAFIPEMLYANIEELRLRYLEIIENEEFKEQFDELLKNYVGRPSPLYYSGKLSEKYRAHIYLKREDLNHTGAHKINNTIGQILLAQRLEKKRIIAETGAGQHGVATATVCALMGMQCHIYMGEKDIKRQAPNVQRMKMLGAEIIPARSGSRTLKDATNEAIRDWINNAENTHYIIGSSIGPHPYPDMVTRFQSVISEEIKIQLKEQRGKEFPDRVVACVGGGSNAAGAFYHFLDNTSVKLTLAEAAGEGIRSGRSAATSILGRKGIIHGCHTLLMQSDEGQILEPHSVSAGLDYPGIGPLHAHLVDSGRAEVLAATDTEALEAAMHLASGEGIIPALETAHALAILNKINFDPDEVVVLCLSGRGDKDLAQFIEHMNSQKQ